ncbi:peptidase, S24/S26A/S26B/S26C family [Formosa agariphila KMM 3901]|uniref:Peptidase, S24/S26A/S26B/S26C family n=2 Tax=Formosa TaxID=225842 RepID=T2KP25_FORAG|nr:peptidase, S24/S26A/S26B/S26C family [Formosa agariphila KMM 3901]
MQLASTKGIKNAQKLSEYLEYKSPEKLYRLERNSDAKPSFAILQDLSKKFENADLNYLITGEISHVPIVSKKMEVNEDNQLPKLVTVDTQGNENIVMVPVSAQAGYINGYGDQDFISTLPTYRLPKLNNGTFRMFEVKGHSMFPTLHSGCIVVGEWEEDWSNIKDNQIYILVTDEGVVVKRVLNRIEKYGNLYLKSDNRLEYPSYPIKTEEIKEVWKVSLAMVFNLLDPATLVDRVNDLEAELAMIKERLS